jgi:mRNA interferase YafQ
MRKIERTTRFKKDYRRETKGQYRLTLDRDLVKIVGMLVANTRLPEKFRDHALTGDWKDHRDCHIKPDLVLIYRLPDEETLQLVRIGSHSELGL